MYYIGDLVPFKLSFFDIMAQQRCVAEVWFQYHPTATTVPLERYYQESNQAFLKMLRSNTDLHHHHTPQ